MTRRPLVEIPQPPTGRRRLLKTSQLAQAQASALRPITTHGQEELLAAEGEKADLVTPATSNPAMTAAPAQTTSPAVAAAPTADNSSHLPGSNDTTLTRDETIAQGSNPADSSASTANNSNSSSSTSTADNTTTTQSTMTATTTANTPALNMQGEAAEALTPSKDNKLQGRARSLANLRPARPGERRNPRGRPKKDYDLAKMAQKHAQQAVRDAGALPG